MIYKNLLRKLFFIKKNVNQNIMKNKYEIIIDKIEKIRRKNNTNWMNILRIAFRHDATKSAQIMKKIYTDDIKISKLANKLTK